MHQTYDGLNGLRGIAAIAVVLFHANGVLGAQFVANGELAVDFFFMLSGFVIALAYDEKLKGGMTLRSFATVRLRRLYPVYLLGLLVGVSVVAGLFTLGQPVFPLWQPVLALALALAFLPLPPTTYSSTLLYPLNPPAWSLAVEMAVNLVYAWLHRWMTTPVLALVALVSLLVLIGAQIAGEPAVDGAQWSSIGYGYLRGFFAFPVGVLLYRVRARLPRGSVLLSGLALAALLAFDAGAYAPAYKLLFIAIAAPLLLIGGLAPVGRVGKALCDWLGRTSYPLYAIHFPAIMLVDSAAIYLGIGRPLAFVALLAVMLVACAPIDRLDERWRRRKRVPS